MTANATPRPWHTGGIFNPQSARPTTSIYGPTAPGDQSGECIAQHVPLKSAALIVRAVNERDGLLAALKNIDVEILEAVANEITEFKHSARMGSVRIIAKQIRAAIARAEESGE